MRICLVEVDGEVPDSVLDALVAVPQVKQAKQLRF